MATTRDFKSLGVWAESADIVIPVEPLTGVAYRDETVTEGQNEAGEGFDTIPNSATFNQRLFIVSSFTDLMDTHGIVGWSDQVDYDIPAMVFGSNGLFYLALQASGPSTSPQDPTVAPTFWEEFVTRQQLAATTGATLIGTAAGVDVQTLLPRVLASFSGSANGGEGNIIGSAVGVSGVVFDVPSQELNVTFSTPFANNLYHAFINALSIQPVQHISSSLFSENNPGNILIGSSEVSGTVSPEFPPNGLSLMVIPNE